MRNTTARIVVTFLLAAVPAYGPAFGSRGSVVDQDGVRLADRYPGDSVADRVAAAIEDCGRSSPCIVIVPAGMEEGSFEPVAIPEGVTIVDLRTAGAVTSRGTWDKQTETGLFVYGRSLSGGKERKKVKAQLGVSYEVERGGSNSLDPGFKDTFYTIYANQSFRGQGESHLVGGLSRKFGAGDHVGPAYFLDSYGNCLTRGDECGVGARFQIRQGREVMSGTVVSAAVEENGSVALRYTGAQNAFSRGEKRLLIKTDGDTGQPFRRGRAKVVAGSNPPQVRPYDLQLSDWSRLCEDNCAQIKNLCFSHDGDTNAGLKLVVPVEAIDVENGVMILDTTVQGSPKPWWGTTEPGSYSLFRCGWTEDVSHVEGNGSSGELVLEPGGYADWQQGDTFEMPMGYAHYSSGITIIHERVLPIPSRLDSNAINVRADTQPATLTQGSVLDVSGPYRRGLNFRGPISDTAIVLADARRAMRIGPRSDGGPSEIRWEFDRGGRTEAFLLQLDGRVPENGSAAWRVGKDGWFSVSENGYVGIRSVAADTALGVSVEKAGDRGLWIEAPASYRGELFGIGMSGDEVGVLRVQTRGKGRSELLLGDGTALAFAGPAGDRHAVLDVGTLTDDRTLRLPDSSGTLVTSGDQPTQGVLLWGSGVGPATTGEAVCVASDLNCRGVRLPDGEEQGCAAEQDALFYAPCS
jgi:hypothetical protein